MGRGDPGGVRWIGHSSPRANTVLPVHYRVCVGRGDPGGLATLCLVLIQCSQSNLECVWGGGTQVDWPLFALC